jgi:N-acetylglucosaminyldiphosphoundecaprenol N-acetyl-beta-D-mannosaminyltransferase
MTASAIQHTEVLGIPITCFSSYDHAAKSIVRRIEEGQRTFCVVINPEKVCFARNDDSFAEIVRKGNMHVCDGVGTALAVRLITGWRIPRITGVGLFFKLVEVAQSLGLKLFLLGAKPETNTKAYEALRQKYPTLQIAGRQHGYFENVSEVIQQINASRADILFAALGSPWQERWLSEHWAQIHVPFCMGVGGSFDVLSGTSRRAPALFQRTGTEFLYRLICQPRRWRRQSVLPGFALRVLFEAVSTRGFRAFATTAELRSTEVEAWGRGRP